MIKNSILVKINLNNIYFNPRKIGGKLTPDNWPLVIICTCRCWNSIKVERFFTIKIVNFIVKINWNNITNELWENFEFQFFSDVRIFTNKPLSPCPGTSKISKPPSLPIRLTSFVDGSLRNIFIGGGGSWLRLITEGGGGKCQKIYDVICERPVPFPVEFGPIGGNKFKKWHLNLSWKFFNMAFLREIFYLCG